MNFSSFLAKISWRISLWFSGVPSGIRPGAHRAQWVCFQAVLLSQDESWRGENRHDSAAALPADRWPTWIRGGGAVQRFGGQIKIWEHFKRKHFQSGFESLFWHCRVIIHPFLLYRRWKCLRLPSCSCESPVWSCEFMAERTPSKLIWRLRLIYGTWWSKRCGLAAAWLTSIRWYCCNQRETLWGCEHILHMQESWSYINIHYYSLTYALVRFL